MTALAAKIATLYIDTNSLRLLVSRGRRVLEWAYLPLEQELISNNVVVDELELALRVKQMLTAHKSQGSTVYVGLSGLHCISRPITLPPLPVDMLDEAVKREARRLLPIPLEQLYLTWQEIPGSDDRSRVFVVALPTTTVDTVVQSLQHAGLKPAFLGIKPLFLARSIEEDTAIIADIQLTEFDIIIVKSGIPQTVRTIAFPDEDLSSEDKRRTVFNEMTRTISFYNANNAEDQLPPDVPVIVSGELSEDVRAFLSDSVSNAQTVSSLQMPFDYPEGFDINLYSANLGLTLHQLRKNEKDESSFMVQNSLPEQYQTQPISIVTVFGIPGAVIAIGLIALLVMNNIVAAGRIESLLSQADNTGQILEERIQQSQEISGQLKELEANVSEVETSLSNYELLLDNLRNQSFKINRDLSEITKRLPTSITLANIIHTNGTLQIGGIASSEKDVLLYITELEDTNLFGEIVITGMTSNEDDSQNFDLLIDTTPSDDKATGINVILRYFPDDVFLISLRQDNDITTIKANAPDEERIVVFLQELEDSGLFSDIALNSKAISEEGGIDFSFTVREILE